MPIDSLSPVDGRYAGETQALAPYFSEWALIRYRVQVEIRWLIFMSERPEIAAVRSMTQKELAFLEEIISGFDQAQANRVKEIENTTRHDVKAVEYYLKERLSGTSMADIREFVHFFCTSEDINNLSYAQMLRDGIQNVWRPQAERLVERVASLAEQAKAIPMLSHTHGQAASPSTVGKELAVFVYRWRRQLKQLANAEYLGKINGAVGAFNTHAITYPDAPWEEISRAFVESLGLTWNPLTTQIESHDFIAELAHNLMRFHQIGIDFDQDMWAYISLGYFRQRIVAHEVGSSTMPHKVNPINFENSEANFGVSNALFGHLAAKLAVSRQQRDLSDSSALRNLGPAFGHSYVALQYALKGMDTVQVDEEALNRDLDQAWEVLAEPIQTVMKKAGHADAYEKLKELTRGRAITREEIRAFVTSLDLPENDKKRLLALTPRTYIGLATQLVERMGDH
jgi:adenylosuccinate lyase